MLNKWKPFCFGKSDMTTVVAVCAGFGGWRLAPTEGSLVTCKDARRSAERQQVQDAGVNDACEIHPASLSSTSELDIDAGSANCCSGVMENLIPGDSGGSGRMVEDFSIQKYKIRSVL